jgi:hypothetical protein
MPTDSKTADAWLKALSTGKNQGCGHVRLLIDQYADFALSSADVPQALIRAFFKYWWSTPVGSAERQRVKYQIVQGPLDGHAVAIVGATGGRLLPAGAGRRSCLQMQSLSCCPPPPVLLQRGRLPLPRAHPLPLPPAVSPTRRLRGLQPRRPPVPRRQPAVRVPRRRRR